MKNLTKLEREKRLNNAILIIYRTASVIFAFVGGLMYGIAIARYYLEQDNTQVLIFASLISLIAAILHIIDLVEEYKDAN